MPRFFFDVDDGALNGHDEVGDEFLDVQMACHAAEGLLYALAKDAPGTLHGGRLLVAVRDSADVPVCRVQLALRVEWLGGAQPSLTNRKTAPRITRQLEAQVRWPLTPAHAS